MLSSLGEFSISLTVLKPTDQCNRVNLLHINSCNKKEKENKAIGQYLFLKSFLNFKPYCFQTAINVVEKLYGRNN